MLEENLKAVTLQLGVLLRALAANHDRRSKRAKCTSACPACRIVSTARVLMALDGIEGECAAV